MNFTRRRILGAAVATAAMAAAGRSTAKAIDGSTSAFLDQLANIEKTTGGRLGVTVLDSDTGNTIGHRQDERFPMCSTFKVLLAAAVLQQVDQGTLSLQRQIPIRESDLLGYAPVSRQHVGSEGLSVSDLAAAAVMWSDNAAANLLYPLIGGPAGLTRFLRAHDDMVTRTDRMEPALNQFADNDPRDTTTPAAMAGTLQSILLGHVLSPASGQLLTSWMLDCKTSDTRLRAGLPVDWKIGDKTGSDGRDTSNDIGILWPPAKRAPLLVSVYLQGARVDSDARDAAIAAVARAIVRSSGA